MVERFLSQTSFTSQEDFIKNLKINVPENFNFGYDVVDAWAAEQPDKPALLWTNDQGECRQFTFADMKRYTDMTASYFQSLGIGHGDMVMLILKRRYEFWFSIVALHKLGAVVIPATHLLTKKDIVYRCNAADIKMIVCAGESVITDHITAAMPESPSVKRLVSVGPEAPEGFDARFSALERTYVYRIADRSSEIDPRIRNCVLHIDDDLNIEAMNKAAEMTIGLHDFGSFATPNPGGTTIREVKTAYWRRIPQHPLIDDGNTMGERYRTPAVESGLLCFTIVADAFARNMVRSLVNGCVQVGIGKRSVDWFAEKMTTPLREGSTGPIAPQGLTLEHIEYPEDDQLAIRAEAIRAKRTL